MPGFHFRETMSGTYTRAPDPADFGEHAIEFTITARARSLLQHLFDHKAEVTGTLHMEGFAADARVEGELTINPVLGGVIRYELEFTADDGKRYRLAGQKDVTIADPVGSMTTLPATVSDGAGNVVARALLRFDKRDLPRFLASFRPTL
jgi:hypothetical protein